MKKWFPILLILTFFITGTVFGGAIDQSNIGTRGSNFGGAFTGVADDSSAVYWNAAGLAFYKGKAEISLGGMFPYIKLDNTRTAAPFAGETTESKKLNIIPNLFALYKITDDFALGFGFYFPYGGGSLEFKNAFDADAGYATKFNLKKDLRAYTFTLSAAYKISDVISIGVGLTLYYVSLNIEVQNKLIAAGPIFGDIEQFVDGVAVSGNVGVMIKPTKDFTIGISTRLPFNATLKGVFEIKNATNPLANKKIEDSSKKMKGPFNIALGLSYYITESWLVSVDLEYQGWNRSRLIESVDATVNTKDYGWKNSLRFGFGTEYKFTPDFSATFGFKISPSATEQDFLGLDNIDLTSYSFFLGFGWNIIKNLRVEGLFMYVYYPDKSQNVVNATVPIRATGEFTKNIIGGAIQVKILF